MYNKEQIKNMKKSLEGSEIEEFSYEKEGDYFIIQLKDSGEFCFRFMGDIVKENQQKDLSK